VIPQCDVPDCFEEAAIGVKGERRCYCHALERMNEERAAHALPPVTFDEDGELQIVH
jgi:hypothetical protein